MQVDALCVAKSLAHFNLVEIHSNIPERGSAVRRQTINLLQRWKKTGRRAIKGRLRVARLEADLDIHRDRLACDNVLGHEASLLSGQHPEMPEGLQMGPIVHHVGREDGVKGHEERGYSLIAVAECDGAATEE